MEGGLLRQPHGDAGFGGAESIAVAVQLVDGRGGVHTGLWGYVLARDVKALFWAALAATAVGFALSVFCLRQKKS